MKKYWLLLKLSYQNRLEYRLDMIFFSLSSALTPVLGLAVWLTTSNFGSLPFSRYEIIAYFILAALVGVVTEMWQSWFISEDITTGHYSAYLLKPLPPVLRYMMDNIGDKAYKISMLAIAFTIIFFVIPKEVWSQYQINILSLLLFLLALVLGYTIMFLMEVCIGLSTVWLYDIGFLKRYLDLSFTFFTGRLIPLSFFPGVSAAVFSLLPFRYAVSFPVEILLNKLKFSQLVYGFAIEIFWAAAIFFLYGAIHKGFVKKYQGFGS